jgi:hypothetical protein
MPGLSVPIGHATTFTTLYNAHQARSAIDNWKRLNVCNPYLQMPMHYAPVEIPGFKKRVASLIHDCRL